MSEHYAPDGYGRVTPYLTVSGAGELIQFIERVFDGQIVDLAERPDGKIAHAVFRIGDSTVEVAEASERFGPMPGALHIYVPDVDRTYRLAIEHGAQVVHEPMEMEYGERASAVIDASGNHWYIATFHRRNP